MNEARDDEVPRLHEPGGDLSRLPQCRSLRSSNQMKTASKIVLCLLFCAFRASGQVPSPAGVAPVTDVSLGYSFMRSTTPLSTSLNLNGVVANITEGITPRLGIKADVGYLRAANVLGTGHHADVLDYLVGPVFYPRRDLHLVTFAHALLGGARVTGVAPIGGVLRQGYAYDFSWAFGGGYEYWFTDSAAIRASVDALHTSFFNAAGGIQGRYDLRPVVGVVYYFGARKR